MATVSDQPDGRVTRPVWSVQPHRFDSAQFPNLVPQNVNHSEPVTVKHIWGPETKDLAVSLLAFAVAIVLATKELILCVTGAVLRASARTFTIGDRIEQAILNRYFASTGKHLGPNTLKPTEED